jgi:hypothetical protein
MGAECWFTGTSCDGHGELAAGFEVKGSLVQGGLTHGGCNPSDFALVYEPHTSPLRVRVCARTPPPVDCPAMVNDFATWDIGPLLQVSATRRAVLVGALGPKR